MFCKNEERCIINFLVYHSDREVSLSRRHAAEAFSIFIESQLPELRESLPFNNEKVGIKFLRFLEKRWKTLLHRKVPTRQEGKRFASTNAETLATHLSAVRIRESTGGAVQEPRRLIGHVQN